MKENDRSKFDQEINESPDEGMAPPTRKSETRVGTVRMVMRMLLGGVIIGREEMRNRFQEKQSGKNISAVELNDQTPIESEVDRARYAAFGAVVKTSEAVQRRISNLEQISNRTFGIFTRAIRPVSNSRLMNPLRRRYDRYVAQGEKVVADWVAAGRTEEYHSRRLVQDTTTESIEEVLDYLAESPEMDELMQDQSVDFVEDMFEDVGGGISNTRLIFSNWINSMIRGRPRQKIEVTSVQRSSSDVEAQQEEAGEK